MITFITIARRFKRMLLIASASFILWHGAEVSAETIVVDDFSSARLSEEDQKIDSRIPWYVFGTGGSKLPPTSIADRGGLRGEPVLSFIDQSQGTLLMGSLSPVPLKNAGDSIKLSVVYAYRHAPGSNHYNQGFVIGLYDSQNSLLASGNLKGKSGETVHFSGYRLGKIPNSKTDDIKLGAGRGMLGDFSLPPIYQASSDVQLNDDAPHTLSLEIVLQKDGALQFICRIDGYSSDYRMDAAQVSTLSFDKILVSPIGRGLGTSGINKVIYLKSVEVSKSETAVHK